MRILYCYRYGILGGVCTQLLNRLRILKDLPGFEVHLLFSQDYGISRTLQGYPYLHFIKDPKQACALARKQQFDAAVVVDTQEYLEGLGQIEDLPLVTEVHTTVERSLKYLEQRSWNTVGYIVPSDYSRRLLAERFDIGAREPVHVVPNSLDAGLFPRVAVAAPGERPIFGWVGKLDDHKNWRGFLQVAAAIREQGLDADFWLIGGETAPTAVQSELIDQIHAYGLSDRCRWFPRIEYRAMHRAYGAVRASGGMMIVTSINESFGMSVLEALVSGCPVLASRVGALPEIAPDRDYLSFYELGDWAAAARLAIELTSPPRGRALGEQLDADRQWLVGQYSCQAVAERYLRALEALTGLSLPSLTEPAAAAAG